MSRGLEQLQLERRAFMALVGTLPSEQLQSRSRKGGWSVIEIAEHVVVAERVVLGGLADFDGLREKTPRSALRRALVLGVLTLGIPVEVPSAAMRPSGTRDIETLRFLWNETEAWMEEFAKRQELRAVFEHPVAGALTLPEAIRLDRAHIRRHRKQIDAILRG